MVLKYLEIYRLEFEYDNSLLLFVVRILDSTPARLPASHYVILY